MGWIGLLLIGYIIYSIIKESSKSNKYNNSGYISSLHTSFIPRSKLNIKKVDLSNIKLSQEQEKLFNLLENTNKNIFVTGKAGTGKSLLLQYFRQHSKKRLVVVAPTGVAALNVGGQTIHSLFKIPPEFIPRDSLKINQRVATLLKHLDTVVIDEISMVRADLMDAIDHRLRQARMNEMPFGEAQIVMFGDLYQLPPVVSDPELHKYFADNHGGYYFFNAHVWKNTLPETYELTKIFRQKDESFKHILNSVRTGEITVEILNELNKRVEVEIPDDGAITLATTNHIVTQINESQLAKLDGESFEYKAIITGQLEKSSFPTEEILRLKKDAQVMLLKNDKEKRWVNGTLGYIESLSKDEIKVNIDGLVYSIPKETWNKIRYYYDRDTQSIEEEVISSFTQYPIRLAWAVTIHKSQGQTYGSVVVDMGDGAFTHGQTYVALSRCKSLEGLYLKRDIFREDILVDPVIINFMKRNIALNID